MYRTVVSNEIFTILIIIGLILIAISKVLYSKRFSNFVFLPGNSKYLLIHTREQKFFDRFDALLFSNFIISSTIFFCLCYKVYYGSFPITIDFILKIVTAIASFLLIKVLFERLLASLFEIDELIDSYLFQKTSYKNYFGLLLIPINALFIYNFSISEVIIVLVLGLYITLSVVGLMVSYKANQITINRNLFYFILFLCALEIAPYLILFKLLKMNGVI
jgi:hypothetical protein